MSTDPQRLSNVLDSLNYPTARADSEPETTVKLHLTPVRRSKRPRRDVEAMEFLGAVGRFLRAAGRRVGSDGDELELAALIAVRVQLDDAIRAAVTAQKERGKSWADIARGTGTTREAAFQKWGGK